MQKAHWWPESLLQHFGHPTGRERCLAWESESTIAPYQPKPLLRFKSPMLCCLLLVKSGTQAETWKEVYVPDCRGTRQKAVANKEGIVNE